MEKYNMEMETNSVTIPGKIMDRIKKNSVVLEFGCAYGRMTRYMKEELQCQVYIVEVDSQAYAHAIQFAVDGFCGNIESEEWVSRFQSLKFDYILFADVLEHLKNPDRILGLVKTLLKDKGEVIISLPNIAHFDILANLYLNRFQYTKIGLLDDTHIHFWGREDLDRFSSNAGYQIVDLDGVYVPPYSTEQRVKKELISEELEKALQKKELNDLYQFFLVLKKSEETSDDEIIDADKLRYFYSYETAAFYFDFGQGYTEEQSIRLRPDRKRGSDEIFFYLQQIPEGCKKVRFDPVYDNFAVISNLKIVGNNGSYQANPLNGVVINGEIVFANTTPHLEIELREQTQWLRFSARIESTRDTHWIELLTELQKVPVKNNEILAMKETVKQCETTVQSQLKELQNKNTELQSQAEALRNKDAELHSQAEALRNKDKELQTQATELKNISTEVACYKQELSKLKEVEEKNKYLQAELDSCQQNIESLNRAIELGKHLGKQFHLLGSHIYMSQSCETIEEFSQLSQEILRVYDAQKIEIDKLSADLYNMTQYARHVEELYHQLAYQYNAVLGSRCWRMTAPLRHTIDFMKAKLKLHLFYKTLWYLKHHGLKETVIKIHRYLHKDTTVPQLKLPSKIESFSELVAQFEKEEKQGTVTVYLPKCLKGYDSNIGKKVLLVSHEMNLTGAPIAIYYFAQVLKENGYCPVMLSPNDGKLTKTIVGSGIPVIISPVALKTNFITPFAQLFQLIILNTIVTAPVLNQIDGMNIPVFWWIHEAQASYTPEHLAAMPPILPNGVSVYTVGGYAKKILEKFRQEYAIKQMLYYIPDRVTSDKVAYVLPDSAKGKTVFCHIGMLEERKGQNIFVAAILQLPEQVRNNSYFVFVGRQCFPPCYDCIIDLQKKYPDHVSYIEEIDVNELHTLYQRIDCLVCSSLDDPMPIVVTEALQFSKPVICSEHTGSAELLIKEQCGFVYRHNDPKELADYLAYVVQHSSEMGSMKQAARLTYEKYFSKKVFKQNVLSAVEKSISDGNDKELGAVTANSLSMKSLVNDFDEHCVQGDCIYQREILLDYDKRPEKKRVLLLTHECSLTGAPIALQNLAESLRQNDVQVLMVSPFDGPISKEFEKCELPTLIYQNIYGDNFLCQQAEKFDLIVLSTVVAYRAVIQLKNSRVPVLWWIHDSRASYEIGGFGTCLPQEIPHNVNVCCGGEYARKQLLAFYPHYQADILYYVSPDQKDKAKDFPVYQMDIKKDAIVFTIIGQQDTRKGHDIFAQAISLLTDEERERAQFFFIGSHLDEEIQKAVDNVCGLYPDRVRYIPQVNRQELFSVYQQTDCIVCSSRDDPMPVFVTEALMMEKVVICSKNTGWSPILEQEDCGLVYYEDDPQKLAEKMRYVLSHYSELQPMQKRGREVYLKYFSEQAFAQQTQKLLASMVRQKQENEFCGTVSVIIPTYNAGIQFETLLQRLQIQKGIRKIEIVIIDSGSTDMTEELSKQYGVRFIPIPHEKFTHSYARNKGAGEATGDILLFMTQDALPVDEFWMYHLAEPILAGEAVAVSCIEQCPEGTDLYYRVSSWNHAKYQGVLENSKIAALSENDSIDDLRVKASLNDVTSMIRADIFSRFLYRFGYAEDLDMGLRLLKAGYKIGLLNTTASVHGHNRPAGYYLKRGFVEAKSLGKICELWKVPVENSESIARRIVYSDTLVDIAVCKTRMMSGDSVPLQQFCTTFLQNLAETINTYNGTAMDEMNSSKDSLLKWCINVLHPWSQKEDSKQANLAYHIAYYLEHILQLYMVKNGELIVNHEQQEHIYSCMEKQFCLVAGSLLAGVEETSPIYQEIQNLAVGV